MLHPFLQCQNLKNVPGTIRNKSFPLIPINSCPPKSYPNEFDVWKMVELWRNKIKYPNVCDENGKTDVIVTRRFE